jgi:hypothetical protein
MYNSDFMKSSFGPTLYLDNQFDDKFLEEKEYALSPIFLDDSIPSHKNDSNHLLFQKTNSRSIKMLNISCDKNFDKKKSRKSHSGSYDSNIVLISSKQEEESRECPIIQEINKLIRDPQILKMRKPTRRKRRYGK